MCSPATCNRCGKVTWSGCGQHVEQVMARVPKAQQCSCTPEEKNQSIFNRIFGR